MHIIKIGPNVEIQCLCFHQSCIFFVPFLRMVDSLQESCHCNDSAVCTASVSCMDDMLGSLEQLSKGHGITAELAEEIHKYCDLVNTYGR